MNLKEVDPYKEYKEITEDLVQYIRLRDYDLCQITGGKGTEIHHIVFKSHGGTNKPNNLILLSKKGHMLQHGLLREKIVLQKELLDRVLKNERKLRRSMV